MGRKQTRSDDSFRPKADIRHTCSAPRAPEDARFATVQGIVMSRVAEHELSKRL